MKKYIKPNLTIMNIEETEMLAQSLTAPPTSNKPYDPELPQEVKGGKWDIW